MRLCLASEWACNEMEKWSDKRGGDWELRIFSLVYVLHLGQSVRVVGTGVCVWSGLI